MNSTSLAFILDNYVASYPQRLEPFIASVESGSALVEDDVFDIDIDQLLNQGNKILKEFFMS